MEEEVREGEKGEGKGREGKELVLDYETEVFKRASLARAQCLLLGPKFSRHILCKEPHRHWGSIDQGIQLNYNVMPCSATIWTSTISLGCH